MTTKKKKEYFRSLLRDKNGYYNLRETVTALFVLVTLVSWIAEQFFQVSVPEYMFYSFVSLVGAGCFGYSIERKQRFPYSNNIPYNNYPPPKDEYGEYPPE